MDFFYGIGRFPLTVIVLSFVSIGCSASPSASCASNRTTNAGLSSLYTAETSEEFVKLPNLLQLKPRCKINSTPWWGNKQRSSQTEIYTIQLRTEIKAQRNHSGIHTHNKRRRRSDGSSQEIKECYEKNSVTSYGSYRVCAECSAVTTLDVDRTPRYINEIICDPSSDSYAFSGEGPCVQKSIDVTVLQLQADGTTYIEETVSMGTGCEFQLYKSSVLMGLN